ncbi:SET domain-containing protein [Schizophyllum commune Loenen D]|nr:SET domain-containing protein [Schizophyllum commune Loenen D]
MSSDSEESDGSHFWSRPSSPHETFDNLEGADANGEWQSRHIGHQVDYRGEIIHEVDWTPWKRADGSSTTFENAALTQSDIEEWDEELAEKRLLAANASIVAAPGKHRALSYSLTWNLDQAVEEKLQRLAVNQYDSDSDFDMNIVEEVERSGAAALDFVNEINDELLPALPTGFRYKEQGYDLGPGVRKTSSKFMVSCNCTTEGYRCHPRICNCQDVIEIKVTNKSGHPIFAYDRERKYRFPQVDDSFEVVECNQHCSCDETCQNRVAQLPRRIPIEIFRTPNRGWGVRSPHPMKAGTVVGTFSGTLIKHEDAENIPDEQRSYCFDLRGKTASTEPGYTEKYTVNAWMTGNWSRFLNHSCKPNLDTVHVVWDTIPEENRPYIAFVANCDILAGIELTLDYHPDLANDDQPKKKRKKRVEDGMIPCDCEAPNCRGWIPGN